MVLLTLRTTGAVTSSRVTMPFSVTSRVFYPYQKRGVRIHRQLVAPPKQPVNTFTRAGTFVKESSSWLGLVPSTPTKLRLPIFPNSLFSFNARDFSTCHVNFHRKAGYDQLRLDPDAHRAYLDSVALRRLNRSANNPEVRRRWAEDTTRYSAARYALDDIFRKRKKLLNWLHEHTWVRNSLPWKSHQPLLLEKQTEHYCDGCRFKKRGGTKLWWRTKSAHSNPVLGDDQADSYLCHACYTQKRDWSAVMPEGYEDVETYDGLLARKQQLESEFTLSDLCIDESARRGKRIWAWCQLDWIRKLPWPTHQPLLFEQKAELKCTKCDRGKRRAFKLWWKSPTGEHICNHCYTRPDWTEIMPKGYEDIRSGRDLVARKKQLDRLASGHAAELSSTSSTNHQHIAPKTFQSTPTRPTMDDSTNLSPSSSRDFSSTAIALMTKEEYAELRKDPERLERYRAERRRSSLERYHGMSPERRRFQIKQNQRYKKQRLQDVIEYRKRVNADQARWEAAHPMHRKLRHWCTRYAWLREESLWKTYHPLVYDEKVQLHCDGCGLSKLNDLKFWWTMLVDTPRYLCPSCYYSSRGWSEVMPKGYEDVQTAKELKARKELLDQSHTAGTNPAALAASSPLRSTLLRPVTKKASNISPTSSRNFSCTSASNGMSKAKYAALRSDPEAYRVYSDKQAAYRMKRHDEDAERREHMRRHSRSYFKLLRTNPVYNMRNLIRGLVLKYPWSRTDLPWKLYRPVVTPTPVEHHCSGCEITRHGGMKLWWHRTLAGSDVFLCHNCFFSKEDWTRAMPEGYEDIKTIHGFIARKKQLVGLDDVEDISGSESVIKATRMKDWCRRLEWFRHLPWKIHHPFLTEERVEDHCARCKYNRHRGLKLWWRSADETICNSCYTNGEWKDIMPQGYEDLRTSKDIRARKEELERQGAKW